MCPLSIYSMDWNLAYLPTITIAPSLMQMANSRVQNYLYIVQRDVIAQYTQANANEPDQTIQNLNLAKKDYKQTVVPQIPSISNSSIISQYALLQALVVSFTNPTTTNARIFNAVGCLNLAIQAQDTFKTARAYSRSNQAYKQADTISLQTLADFHDNDDQAIKNRVSLAKNNVLIQKEHELIDQVNASVLSAKGLDYSTLDKLQEFQNIGKTELQRTAAQRIRVKVETQQTKAVDHILTKELNKRKLATAACFNRMNLPIDMTRLILSQHAPSAKIEIAQMKQECYENRQDLRRKFKVLQSLRY